MTKHGHETRPDRVLYNLGVALRLVDQLLSEVGTDLSPTPTLGEHDAGTVDRVAHALMLVERMESDAPSPRGHLSSQLRGTLKSLLVDLERSAGPEPRRAH